MIGYTAVKATILCRSKTHEDKCHGLSWPFLLVPLLLLLWMSAISVCVDDRRFQSGFTFCFLIYPGQPRVCVQFCVAHSDCPSTHNFTSSRARSNDRMWMNGRHEAWILEWLANAVSGSQYSGLILFFCCFLVSHAIFPRRWLSGKKSKSDFASVERFFMFHSFFPFVTHDDN